MTTTTTNRTALMILGAVLLAFAARAADRTWNGGGSDALWSADANWGGTAPVADDALFFGGTSRLTNTNDLDAGTAFAGLTFNSGAGAFALNGNGITLGGNVVNLDNDAQSLNMDVALGATRIFNASNGNLVVNGDISGSGGLTKSGHYALTLAGNNTYEGLTTISTGTVVITHANALGSAAAGTTVDTSRGAALDIRGGITLVEPLTFTGANVNKNCLVNGAGTNTISSMISSSGGRHFINGGSILNITGGITNNPFFVLNGSGRLNIQTTPLTMGTGGFYADDYTLTVFEVASNVWGELTIAKGTVRMGVANALPPAGTIRMGLSYGPLGTLDLNGFDQTTARLYNGTPNAGLRSVTSLTPATLTINQSAANSAFEGVFSNAVSLLKMGTGTLILTNGVSSNTGSYTVSNGTLVVATTARLSGTTNVVVTGGTLELRATDALNDGAALLIADGGPKVKVNAGLNEIVNTLFFGGVQQASGTYGATDSGAQHIDDAHFTGTGLLSVLSNPPITPVSATWDAEGADLNFSTAANWAGDAAPAFDGTTYAIFGMGGTTATVDTVASLYGMTFNANGNFTVAAGAGVLTNGLGGIFAQVPNTTARTYTLAEDLVMTESQVWTVTNNGAGGTTLTLTGAVSDEPLPYNLTKAGNGTLVLAGNNTYDGLTTVKTGGVIRVTHANGLGSTNGATVVENGGWIDVVGGFSVPEPITITGDAATSYSGVLRSNGGSNIWSGKITTTGSRIRVNGGSFDIVGGVVGSSLVVGANGGTFMRISEKPILTSSLTAHSAGGGILLAVTNNTFTSLEVGGSYLRTDLPGVLPPTVTLQQGAGSAKSSLIDLNGNDQTVGQFKTGWSGPETRILYSLAPATLTVNQSGNSEYNGSLTGAVTLVKTGTGALTLAGTNSTYGSFVVSNGTLLVNNIGTFGPNSTNIVVGGTGALTLSNSVAIADSAVVAMPAVGISTAKITLAAGVNEKVGWLFYGDKMQRVGTYGAAGSGATHIDNTHFVGSGLLTVLRDNSGTMLLMQ